MGVLQKIGNKAKDALGNLKDAAKKVGQNLTNKVDNAIDNAKSAGAFALLSPVKPILQAALKSKGISPSNDLELLGRQFYQEIVLKNDFDETIESGSGQTVTATPTSTYLNHLDPVTISAIVSAIFTWIKETREKKAAGKPLTKAQEKALDVAETAENQIDSSAEDYAKNQAGDVLFKVFEAIQKNWLIIVAALVLIALAVKSKKL